MQTFLPYSDFHSSAKCLDRQRLGKQRVEVLQLLKALLDPSAKGWKNHPAAKMWKGYEVALATYGACICNEWTRRGYADTCKVKIMQMVRHLPGFVVGPFTLGLLSNRELLPTWMGDQEFHASHRSNLLRKDPEWYAKYDWVESDDLPYIWPENETITCI